MRVTEADLSDPRVTTLIALHQRNMLESSPPGTSFALDLAGLSGPQITIWAVWADDVVAGIGAIKQLSPTHGEIKSMRTDPAHLRQGVAALLLDRIMEHARSTGITRLSLETGTGPVFEPALALYRKRGFTNGPAFGDYKPTAFNQYLHLEL
ncbi:GNAT family N-acetyltransferase [Qipengyuania sp.]|uniref:GNAT family N-acetyltransferase n=1 Tax=Qipengyuania sp. TaxID=2004515 RepID=UPI0035C7AC28